MSPHTVDRFVSIPREAAIEFAATERAAFILRAKHSTVPERWMEAANFAAMLELALQEERDDDVLKLINGMIDAWEQAMEAEGY